MSLTITNEETCRLARELASLTGVSPEKAITAELRSAIEREQAIEAKIREMSRAGSGFEEIEAVIKRPMTQRDIDHWMYDENGLPY